MLFINKKAFTLIELMVVVAIISVLATLAVPIYDKQILKGRFEEAKVTMQAIALAQERYKMEVGRYFSYNNGANRIRSEQYISDKLKVKLYESNNFIYEINPVDTSGEKYQITSILRPEADSSDTVPDCHTNFSYSTPCKQRVEGNNDASSIPMNEWVKRYKRKTKPHNANKCHYITMDYPIASDNAVNGIDYTNIHTCD